VAALALATAACSDSSGGSPDAGAGGAGGGGGHGGGGGGAGGSGGSGGSTGGSGGAAGAGGGAGQGGSGGFQCGALSNGGPCQDGQVGLVCTLAGEAPLGCVCVPATGGPYWQCGATNLCPTLAPSSGTGCPTSSITTINNFAGCKYVPQQVCWCQFTTDTAGAWSCNDVSCPATPPTGPCSGAIANNGFNCEYGGSTISCNCAASDRGAPSWTCNGQATPSCPAAWPGSGVDCGAFQPGTVCNYPAGNFTGGPCTCTTNGAGRTWSCAGG
jgi:hypothetical protein